MSITAEKLRLYAVSDCSWLQSGETLVQVVEILLQNGITCLQFREKQMGHEEIVRQARQLLPSCRAYGVPLIINDDVQAVLEAGADGVHVGQSDMTVRQARAILGPDKIIGTSAHSVEEAIAAQQAGADYLGSGAAFGSTTKKDAGMLSHAELRAICSAVSIPVVAIGGINRYNILQLTGSGVDGVAVISALFAADDKPTAVKEMLRLAELVACK